MLLACLKRSYLAASPWVFGQSSIPKGLSEMTDDPDAHRMILKYKTGFNYAFNSVLDAYCTNDLEILEQCMEGSLFSFVKKGLSDLAKENISFKRLHNNEPKIIPLDFSIISGVNIDRSKNPHISQLKIVDFDGQDFSNNRISKLIFGSYAPDLTSDPIKKNKIYINTSPNLCTIARVDIAYEGQNFIGLFKDNEELTSKYSGNSYHIFRFESEVMKNEGSFSLMAFFQYIYRFEGMELNDFFNKDWILVDIDFQLEGNPIVKS